MNLPDSGRHVTSPNQGLFLNDNGGREERPWERGWVSRRQILNRKHDRKAISRDTQRFAVFRKIRDAKCSKQVSPLSLILCWLSFSQGYLGVVMLNNFLEIVSLFSFQIFVDTYSRS